MYQNCIDTVRYNIEIILFRSQIETLTQVKILNLTAYNRFFPETIY